MTKTRRAATLPVGFFSRPAEVVARELIGTIMRSEIGGVTTSGRIVETEAYLGEVDPASHGYRGRRNARNEAIFGPPGNWYVYLSYGMHWCANLVAAREGQAAAVLIRALEPLDGLETMRARRAGVADRLLCAGPGRLCQALGITRALDGLSMARSAVSVVRGTPLAAEQVLATPRIGISQAADWPLRFVQGDCRWASRVSRAP
ncbi:MAG TPA: DNA-3-methyladenine glycosylase [Gemmatimonadales bacterium]|nr:DNA-3-methyladenine glycosylase [Gemmatimonadales bacterium]